jgi:triosephosphate isomerase
MEYHDVQLFFQKNIEAMNDTEPIKSITQIICPVYPLLWHAQNQTYNQNIKIGAQNVSEHEKGAFTGEVSATVLKSINVEYCIIGHSERRQFFHDTDEIIRQKWLRLRENQVDPIICVGETLTEREKGKTFSVIKKQINTIFHDMPYIKTEDVMVAYEPVWAIGTGKTATPEMAQEVHLFIRGLLEKFYGKNAYHIPILYGGSVKESNIGELLSMPDIDGALIGGASLDPVGFANMVMIAESL